MHPLFGGTNRMLIYLACWIPVVLLFSYLMESGNFSFVQGLEVMGPLCLIYAFVCLSPWYLCRVLPIGSRGAWSIAQSHAAATIVAAFFWLLLGKGIGLLITRWDPPVDARVSAILAPLFALGLLLYLLSVAGHYVFLGFQQSRDAEMQTREALVLARDAELKALKAQINPHFLFNSLNSISALTMIDPAKARDMCILLSDFLRTTLSLGDKAVIAFSDELALTRTYLGVEQIRFGPRLRVEERVEPGCGACYVPPLLVQPLIENAIKHGVANMLEGSTVRLEASMNHGFLNIKVENEFDPETPSSRRNGYGLVNVRGRLKARYEHRARLDTGVAGNIFHVELTLPCEEAHA